MMSGFAEAFAAIRDALTTRITQKGHAAGVIVPADDLAQSQTVLLWMTIDPELQAMLLLTALAPADWERLEPDLPKIAQVFHAELAFARAALRRLKDETVRRGLADERRRQCPEGLHDELDQQEGDQGEPRLCARLIWRSDAPAEEDEREAEAHAPSPSRSGGSCLCWSNTSAA
jgi:hypothetical protein